jgi:hypothetical protein
LAGGVGGHGRDGAGGRGHAVVACGSGWSGDGRSAS